MPKTVYYTAATLDGFLADSDNSVDWLFAADSSGEDQFTPFFARCGAFAMGRTTWEWVVEHESLRADPSSWHGFYGDTPGWVFANRPLDPIPGIDVRFVRGDVRPVHAD